MAISIQIVVVNMKLKNEELIMIMGGAVTASFITSCIKIFTTIIDFGRKVGSSLRRIKTGSYC